MKNLLNLRLPDMKYGILEKVEFWLATALYGLAITAIFSEGSREEGALLGLYYLRDILIMTLFYVSFLLLNFLVIPRIRLKEAIWLNTAVITAIIVLSFMLFPHLKRNFVLLTLAGYFILKFGIIFLWRRFRTFREEKGGFYAGILIAVLFYLLLMFFLFAGNAEELTMGFPGIILPFAIILYGYSYRRLIPAAMKQKHPFRNYLWKVFLVLLAAAVPLAILGYVLLQDEEVPFVLNAFNAFVQFLITVPIAWFTWKRHMRGKEEIRTLQKELGQSTAKFDFLRSQINPHFLFNTLNTLYGTALQENAERTGEGIQQLGDMMRFMLHENMQEKISLAREIEYLRNFINLQKLRTDLDPNVKIESDIQEPLDHSQISPMLLIPFVENAFKHGISLRESSHIKISLEKHQNVLNFDVYNSRHLKPANDPERNNNGVGLPNVKQRLQLLYPEKHSLIIRETNKEYFVHLTLDLS